MGRGQVKYTAEQMTEAFSSGDTFEEIAEFLGVSRQRVGQLSVKYRGAGEGHAFRKMINLAHAIETAETRWPELLQRIATAARAQGLEVSAVVAPRSSVKPAHGYYKHCSALNINGHVCRCHSIHRATRAKGGISWYWRIQIGHLIPGATFRIVCTPDDEYFIFPGDLLPPGNYYIRSTDESAYPNRMPKTRTNKEPANLRQYKDRWDLLKG